MKNMLKKISIVLFLVYVAFGVYLYLNQRHFLYFPTPDGTTKYSNLTLKVDGESINVITLNVGHPNAILYFGGNAESMVGSADYIAKQFPQFTVYLLDYRGYGKSSGVAGEDALYKDALKLYDTIKSKHKRISVGGRSLGSGIATYVAAHREVSKLVLITPFDSIVNVAQGKYPLYPASLLLKERYDSLSRVPMIHAKTLIIFAQNDKVIPRESTQNLIDAFMEKELEVIIIDNRGHIDISSDDKYYKSVQDFIGAG
ncbi:MAG: lysophospholipase [Sulfurovum sp.]|nr:lysophospholipase [Sulfurovum sp.]